MSLRDELLSPIPGDSPGGTDLRYDPVYDAIKEARREDDGAPQGEWTTERKTADWAGVIKLAKDVLATRSKDLQVAAWLAEASLHKEGYAGFAGALDLTAGLVEEHWEHLFPELEDDDAELRVAPLEWIAVKLDTPIRLIPLDTAGYHLVAHRESRTVPTEEQASDDSRKAAERKEAVESGKATPEDVEAAFTATPKAWFKALASDIAAALAAVKQLDKISKERFGDVAPNFSRLREALEEVQRAAVQQLKRKLEIDPDPVEEASANAELMGEGGADAGAGAGGSGGLSIEPTSRDDATARVVTAARYLRLSNPYDPAPYLMLRGLRWGELRAAGGGPPDPKLLEAPATSVRSSLKSLLLDGRWSDLLEACEGVMGTPQGRGWLDLQRYALTACEALDAEYAAVTLALRGALKSLLADVPQLLDMTLMDDTPTANAETREWLRPLLAAAAENAASDDGGGSAALSLGGIATSGAGGRDPYASAMAEVRAGRADRAVALLMREAAREKTSRGRFLLQVQLSRIMVDAGHESVAMPILEQLLSAIDTHRLEEWEAGDVVAAPMALLYRVLEKTNGDSSLRQNLYLRICRLDPIQAISFAQA